MPGSGHHAAFGSSGSIPEHNKNKTISHKSAWDTGLFVPVCEHLVFHAGKAGIANVTDIKTVSRVAGISNISNVAKENRI